MNTSFKIIVRAAWAIVLAAAFLMARPASAQVSSINLQTVTNAPPYIGSSTSITNNNVFLLTRDCELSLDARYFTTNSAGLLTVSGSFSIDTTNFGLAPFTLSGYALSNGVPGLTSLTSSNSIPLPTLWTNFNHSVIAAFTAVQITLFTNAGNATTNLFLGSFKLNRPTINTQTY